MLLDELVCAGPYAWEVPVDRRADMRVPARIYADDALIEAMVAGEAVSQLMNITTLPGVVDRVYGMPDMHEGYGFPVGGVAATLMGSGNHFVEVVDEVLDAEAAEAMRLSRAS